MFDMRCQIREPERIGVVPISGPRANNAGQRSASNTPPAAAKTELVRSSVMAALGTETKPAKVRKVAKGGPRQDDRAHDRRLHGMALLISLIAAAMTTVSFSHIAGGVKHPTHHAVPGRHGVSRSHSTPTTVR
jgi:hypothetical protein